MNTSLLSLALGLIVTTSTANSDPLSLSRDQAIRMAIDASEEIRIRRATIEKTEYRSMEVRASTLPQLSAEATWNRYIDSPRITLDMIPGSQPQEFPLKKNWEFNTGLRLTQVIWAFGKIRNAIQAADKAVAIEKLSYAAARREVAYAASVAYDTLLFASRSLAIAEESHQNALKNESAMKSRYTGGRLSRYENVKMAADVASRVPHVLEAQKNVALATERLKTLLHLPSTTRLILTDPLDTHFPNYSLPPARDKLASHPTLAMLETSIQLNESIVTHRKRDFLPTLSGFASYQYGGDANAFYVGTAHMHPTFVVGLVLSLTLWDSGATWGRYQQALRDRNVSQLQYDQTQKALTLELTSAIREYHALIETYKANTRAVELAERSYRISLSSFSGGQLSQSQVNDAELLLTAAKLNAELTLYRIHVLKAQIQKLTSEGPPA